jgi:allantoate deiminase
MVASGSRAKTRCEALKVPPFSDNADYLFRSYLSDGFMATRDQVGRWMVEAGMTTRTDDAGNLIGRYEARSPAPFTGRGDHEVVGGGTPPKALLIASHLDSVRDAGAFDGPLGVMLGIELVAALDEAGRRLPFAIEIYGFGDEEGSRFSAAMLTSRAVAGKLEASALNVTDRAGVSLAEVLQARGLQVTEYLNAMRDPSEFIGYFEAHIEQGPVLEAENLALGIVTAIAAQARFEAVVEGVAGHAGTSSMALRHDALAAAAEMVLDIEEIARFGADAGQDGLVATVGRMTVEPGAVNVVPGTVRFSIDVRAGVASARDACAERIIRKLHDHADKRGVKLTLERVHELPESPCDASMMDHLESAFTALKLPARRMVSGAGHDAMIFADLMPTAMLFIRCAGGISHNPLEGIEAEDAELALKAMLKFIDQLETTYEPAA